MSSDPMQEEEAEEAPAIAGDEFELEEWQEEALEGEPLGKLLTASGMPFALLDLTKRDMTTLLTPREYADSAISFAFAVIMNALMACWHKDAVDKRAIVCAMIAVRSEHGHPIVQIERPAGMVARKGTFANTGLAARCADYVTKHKSFILCFEADADATIHTWCSPDPDLDRFDWLFLHALCRSFHSRPMGERKRLDAERILQEFGLARPLNDNEKRVRSMFSELAALSGQSQ